MSDNTELKLIATAKDGGTKAVYYKGIRYCIDFRIGSTTRGCVYDDYPTKGNRVDPELEKEIQEKFKAITH